MKKLLTLILPLLLLAGCSTNTSSISSTISTSQTSEIQHDYSEIENKKISWNSTFFTAKTAYFVYFYSLSCSHCAHLKNRIIDYGLSHDNIYFCQDSKDTKLQENVDATIGISSSDKLAIRGFPSLIKIENLTLKMNVAGEESICSILSL